MTERSEQLCAAFAARLQRVRGNLTDDEFAQLVSDVLSTAQRFEEIEARGMGRQLLTIPTFKEPEVRS
jgi:hypothetical protein